MDVKYHQFNERSARVTANQDKRRVLCTLVVLVTLFLYFNFLTGRTASNMPSTVSNTALALGFALTPTYGMVVVRNSQGEILNTAKVQGDEQYLRMMRQLSDPRAQHLHPPYGTLGEGIADWPRQALRRARTSMGLPASPDVGRLATLLQQLLSSVELKDGPSIAHSGAILTLPDLVYLYEEDACDTLTYLGIHDLIGTHIAELHPRTLNSAFVGYGFGACNNWRDPEACKEEYRALPHRAILLVDYSRGALSVVWDRLASGVGIASHGVVDFDAGSDTWRDGGERWSRLRQHIHDTVEGTLWRTVDEVLLTGESAGDLGFQNAVELAVREYGVTRLHVRDANSIVVQAASDMAWRAAEIQRLFPGKDYFPCPPT